SMSSWYMNQNNNGYDDIHVTAGSTWGQNPKIQMLNLKANDASAFPVIPANASNASVFEPNFTANVIDFNAAFATMEATSLALQSLSNNLTLMHSNHTPISYPYTSVPAHVKFHVQNGMNVLNIDGTV